MVHKIIRVHLVSVLGVCMLYVLCVGVGLAATAPLSAGLVPPVTQNPYDYGEYVHDNKLYLAYIYFLYFSYCLYTFVFFIFITIYVCFKFYVICVL